jgi:alanine dehydrogenase
MAHGVRIGFPSMLKEMGEKRVFLPSFIQSVSRFGDVYLEEGYGSRLGFAFDDFRQGNLRVHQTDHQGAYQKDYVIVLRAPNDDELRMLTPGSCLVSMLHYPTRPQRVQLMQELGINAISIDSIVDDNNVRLVENMRAVAWNGLETAFNILEKDCPGLVRHGLPYFTTIFGTGMVGKHTIDAATKLGSIERNNRHIALGGPGAMALCIGRNLASSPDQLEPFFRRTDILVDASNRRDPSLPIVPNDWLAWLPPHAVVVDLAVDPYLLDNHPITVRGVEGIPQGNLDRFIFTPDDPEWDKTVPESIPSHERRTVVSCYSWPGLHPTACMVHYARQLAPLMEVLLTQPYASITLQGNYFERALARARLPEN